MEQFDAHGSIHATVKLLNSLKLLNCSPHPEPSEITQGSELTPSSVRLRI